MIRFEIPRNLLKSPDLPDLRKCYHPVNGLEYPHSENASIIGIFSQQRFKETINVTNAMIANDSIRCPDVTFNNMGF